MAEYLERIVAQLDITQVEAAIARLESQLVKLETRAASGTLAQNPSGFLARGSIGGQEPQDAEIRALLEERSTAIKAGIRYEQLYAENASAYAAFSAELRILQEANVAINREAIVLAQAELRARAHPAGVGIEFGADTSAAEERVRLSAQRAEAEARNLAREAQLENEDIEARLAVISARFEEAAQTRAQVRERASVSLNRITQVENEILAGEEEINAATLQRAETAKEAEAEARRTRATSALRRINQVENEILASEEEIRVATFERAELARRAAVAAGEAVAGQVESLQSRRAILEESLKVDSTVLEEEAQTAVLQRQYNVLLKERTDVLLAEAGLEAGGGAAAAGGGAGSGARRGLFRGLGGGAGGALGGGAFLQQAEFFAGAILVFGLITQIKEAIKAVGELQKQFGVIQVILDQFGQGDQIAHIKNQILDLSVLTATAGGEVAKVERQLAGVFANPATGVPDFGRAGVETKTALEFAKVTGESISAIVDQFSAISVSFADPATHIAASFSDIANEALILGQSLGVPEADILKFTSDLAPLGASLGFTATQLAGLGAVAEQATGIAASGLAEKIGRSLAGLQDKFSQIVTLFGESDATKPLLKQLGEAFGAGDIPQVLELLVSNYQKLNKAQLENLALIVGGRREAGTFYALLDRAPETLKALGEGYTSSGQAQDLLEKRFKSVTETITFQFDQAKIAFQRFLIEILNSGLAEGLGNVVAILGQVVGVLGDLIGLFGQVNDFFGGWPVQIASTVGSLYLLVKVLEITGNAFAALRAKAAGSAVISGAAAGAEGAAVGAAGAPFGAVALSSLGDLGFLGATKAVLGAGATTFGVGAVITGLAIVRQKVQDKIHSDGVAVTDAALAELQKGTPENVIRERASAAYGGGLSSVVNNAATFLTGNKDVSSLITDAVQKNDNARKVAQIQALSQQTENEARLAIIGGSGSDQTNTALAEQLAKDPTSDVLNALADERIAAISDPALLKILNDARTAADLGISGLTDKGTKIANAVKLLTDQNRTQSIDELTKAFAKGEGGSAALIDILQSQVDALNTAIQGVKDAGGDLNDPKNQKLLSDLDKLNKQLTAVVQTSILGPITFAQHLRDILGQSTSQDAYQQTIAEIDAASAQLAASNQLDPKTAETLLTQGVTALKDARQKRADAVAGQLEKDQILAQGVELTPGQKRLEAAILLAQAPAANQLDALSTQTGVSVAVLKAKLEQQYVDTGRLDLGGLTALKEATITAKKKEIQGIQTEIDALVLGNQFTPDQHGNDALIAELQKKIGTLQGELDKAAGAKDDEALLRLQLGVEEAKLQILKNIKRQTDNLSRLLPFIGGKQDADIAAEQKRIDDINAALTGPLTGAGAGASAGANSGSVAPDPAAALKVAQDTLNKRKAELNAQKAAAAGDPVAIANLDAQIAALDAEFARTHGDSVGLINAQAAAITANRARDVALADVAKANRELLATQSGDPVQAAEAALQDAKDAEALAVGEAAKARAAAAVINAERSLSKTISSVLDAQTQLAIAVANAAGHSVDAAKLALDEAKRHLAEVQASTPGDAAAIAIAQATVRDRAASLVQTTISEGESAIQTDLTLKRITKAQAVAELQALYAKATSLGATKKELDQIAIEIQNLTNSLGQDLQFNLPSTIKLPTLYEARRLSESPPPGATGSNSYQDNRQISVQVYAQTNATPAQIGAAVAAAVGAAPNTYSTQARRYP